MKKIISFCLIVISLFLVGYGSFLQKENFETVKKQKELQEKNQLKSNILSHYNKYVKTSNESSVYKLIDGKYQEYGLIGNNIELELEDINIDYNTKYFHIVDLDLYIGYENVLPIQELVVNNDINYKKFVKFNENIVTENETSFYDSNGLVYKIKEGVSLPIIIKDTDKYYVEFNNKLLYVKKSDVKVVKKQNTSEKTRDKIRVLTYHTIYNPEKEECTNTVICHPISQFESHMKYLSDNNYLTLTMEELELFLDGKIRIPEKSIVITLDDGKYHKNAVNIVEKYKVNATYFIITSLYDVSKTKSYYMNFESHTHDMHNNWVCPGGNQGGQFLCESKEKAIKDLKKSQELLGGAHYLAYPYFDFNDKTIEELKEAGFRLAFIGEYNTSGYSSYDTNRYMIRRITVFSNYDINDLKELLK